MNNECDKEEIKIFMELKEIKHDTTKHLRHIGIIYKRKIYIRCAYIKNIRKNTSKWFNDKTGICGNKKKTNPNPVDGKT